MFALIQTWNELRQRGIMGINQRNADYILRYNDRRFYPLVDNKILTKQKAIQEGISAPELYGVINTQHEIKNFAEIVATRNDFVIKPAKGAGGEGIIVIADRYDQKRFKTVSGKLISYSEIEYQLSNILTGLYSLGGSRDSALIEYRVKPDPIFKSISYEGVPDLRIIVLKGYPIMSMLRLPTRQSNGKANLHQGAIGVGVDLSSGKTLRGSWFNEKITHHPDTDNEVSHIQLPEWDKFILLASQCYEMVQLGYIGVDLVLDKEQGPMILEINARPGLNIQIANDDGLARRAKIVEAHLEQLRKMKAPALTAKERVAFSQQAFAVL